jgi:hypothetical protein
MTQKRIDWLMHAELALADVHPLENRLAQLGGIDS